MRIFEVKKDFVDSKGPIVLLTLLSEIPFQAVIPQGVISFVLAKEYNLSVNEFSTAYVL